MLKKLARRTWHSPTLTTWGSFFSKTMGMIVVLPLVLTKFELTDITLWFFFTAIISLQSLFQMGFSATFIRLVSYGYAGADCKELQRISSTDSNLSPERVADWETISSVCQSMKYIYRNLALLSALLFLTLGSLAANTPISDASNPQSGWLSWIIVIVANSFVLYGNQYTSYLIGLNKIALVRRWEILSGVLSVASSILVLIFNGGMLELIIATQVWPVVNTLRNYFICRYVFDGRFKRFKKNNLDDAVWQAAWPSAWRSGLGVAMSTGIVQLSGVVYTQIGEQSEVAQYWLCLKLLTLLSTFSRAPFYTKIPNLSRLWVSGQKEKMVSIAKKGITISTWVFLIGFLCAAFLGEMTLNLINSNIEFPESRLWALMGLAFLIERIYAFHLQLYSITNTIIWHIVNGVGGTIMICVLAVLVPKFGVLAFPLAMIVANASFPLIVCTKRTYSTFNLSFLSLIFCGTRR
jgi:hypothetical protein